MIVRAAVVALLLAPCWTKPPRAAEPPPAERPCEPLEPGETTRVDLRDVPLRKVARLVSCAASMNLLFRPPDLGDRRVTVVAPRPVDEPTLRALFRATLSQEGLVLERRGGYHVIRPEAGDGQNRRSTNGR
ncbi:MAG: hypothetical protein ACQEXJ_17320 [Myxococcota bacterium]